MSSPEYTSPTGFGRNWLIRTADSGSGDVITFYSYKGGTGRSMALVNCAGLIAHQLPIDANPMLLVDFDLEAPGLHRYLSPYLEVDVSKPGVVDLFDALRDAVLARFKESRIDDETIARLVDEFDLTPFVQQTKIPRLSVITAGRFDENYDRRITQFPWEDLFAKAPALFRCLGERFARENSFTFVDSRTGLSDTSNICTALLPNVLVMVFTPNSQSLTGVEHLVRKTIEYRDGSSDIRPLRVYPLPSRVDNQYEEFRKLWRTGVPQHPLFGSVTGYQPIFQNIFQSVLGMNADGAIARLTEYFDVVQVPHTGDYSYGERLCFAAAASTDSLSIRANYEQFLPWIATGAQPWERPATVLLNQQAAQWLRSAGVNDLPANQDGWPEWFDRLSSAVGASDSGRPRPSTLADDERFDIAIVLVLAYGYRGEFTRSIESILQASQACDENISSAVPSSALTQLVRLCSLRLTPAYKPDTTGPIERSHEWLQQLESLMERWYPVRSQRRLWLEAAIELAETSGWTETRRGLQEKLVAMNRSGLGEQHPDTLTSISHFAGALHADGNIQEAKKLQEQVLATRRTVLGEEHTDTISSMLDLARTLTAAGDPAGARSLQEKAVEIRQSTLGETNALTWAAMNELATTLGVQSEWAAARALLEKIVNIQRVELGDMDDVTLASMDRLSETIDSQGYLDEAKKLQEQTRELRRRARDSRNLAVVDVKGRSERENLARSFLAGAALSFENANQLWKKLKGDDEIALARKVLARIRSGVGLLDSVNPQRKVRTQLCCEEALLTSKDPELGAAMRHDLALQVLAEQFDIEDEQLDGEAEILGIAAGIYKRRWNDLGQLDDLIQAGRLYERAAKGELGDDAYAHINAAFVEDLLAHSGIDEEKHRTNAHALRQRIVDELRVTGTWWNTATLAEAFFGLQRYSEATLALSKTREKPEPWKLQTCVQQLATLAKLHEDKPLQVPQIRTFFEKLLPEAVDSVRSAMAGKVGIALSGGGFRASFYHLGMLARLAELDVLRKVEVLSCVSGGSIVGASYWLALRRRLLAPEPLGPQDYVTLIQDLIREFEASVAADLRGTAQPSKARLAWRIVRGEKGLLDPEVIAQRLEENFYRPMMPGNGTLFMHDLPFNPSDHSAAVTGSPHFHPGKHNWLRNHKVPALVINATTVNTAHAWQFTPTWMGESPWAVHESADSIPRLEWSWYQPQANWQIALGRAVAASAGVPGVVAPLRLDDAYEGMQIQLVDGGVHDNQGTVSLLALNCNVLIVSDACGQLLLEDAPTGGLVGQASYAGRSMSILMERIRLANFADLSARQRSGLVRGLMFLHMKAGLDADTRRLRFSQEAFDVRRTPLSPSGMRKDFQQALAELRTDINAFTPNEARALMACGYQMAMKTFESDLGHLTELWETPRSGTWPFAEILKEITSTAAATPLRGALLEELRKGSKVDI